MMHTELLNTDLAGQMFENAITAVALSFIALASLAAILVYVFIVWECVRLTREPKKRKASATVVPIASARIPTAVLSRTNTGPSAC